MQQYATGVRREVTGVRWAAVLMGPKQSKGQERSSVSRQDLDANALLFHNSAMRIFYYLGRDQNIEICILKCRLRGLPGRIVK